jgi:hypothetical protein
MIDLGAQTSNLGAISGLLHRRPPARRMVSASARALNIGAPHHRLQPHHRDRRRRYRPSATSSSTLGRSADSILAARQRDYCIFRTESVTTGRRWCTRQGKKRAPRFTTTSSPSAFHHQPWLIQVARPVTG